VFLAKRQFISSRFEGQRSCKISERTQSKQIFVATIAAALVCAGNLMAQEKVQWRLVSEDVYKTVGLAKDLSNRLADIQFVDETTGFICTVAGGVVRTDNGGVTWRLLYDSAVNRGEYFFLSKDVWFSGYPAFSESNLARTLDGGKNWQVFKDNGVPCFVTSFHFLTPDVGWAVSAGSEIGTTKDGGKAWSVIDCGIQT